MTKSKFKIPKVIFDESPDARADYLCSLAGQILQKRFVNRDFLVLPYLKKDAVNTIYFPDLSYPKKFWREILRHCPSVGEPVSQACRKIIQKLLPPFSPPKISHIDPNFWKALSKTGFFEKELSQLKTVTVLPVDFGPGASFNFTYQRKKLDIYLTFRTDRPAHDLPRTIISALVLAKHGRPGKSPENYWRNRFYSEFLTKDPNLKKFCPDLKLPKITPADVKTSQSFLTRLGVLTKKLPKNVSKILSPQENLIFAALQENKILTHDKISEVLWGENSDEKFSLWAITKLMQKLRAKLQSAGGSPFLIHTLYGQGYTINP